MPKSLTLKELKQALTLTKVKGRSKANTREEAEELCKEHGLIRDDGSLITQNEVPELPLDMLHVICDKIVFGMVRALEAPEYYEKSITKSLSKTIHTLLAMRCSCKFFAEILHPKSTYWFTLLEALIKYYEMDANKIAESIEEGRWTPLRICALMVTTGCEICGAKRIRKIYWEFGGRCCYNCLKQITTSCYRIRERYLLEKEELEAHNLLFITADLYAPVVGPYSLDFYLNRDVLKVLRHKYNLNFSSLEDAYNYIHRDRLENERLIRERNEDMFRTVQTAINLDFKLNMDEMIKASRTFREACKKPPSEWPHKRNRNYFVYRVAAQCMPYLNKLRRDKWFDELKKFEQTVIKSWISSFIQERLDIECTKEVLWEAFSQFKTLVPISHLTTFPNLDYDSILHSFKEKIMNHRHTNSILNQIGIIRNAQQTTFPEGTEFHPEGYTCPCGRQGLKSLQALKDHIKNSRIHPP